MPAVQRRTDANNASPTPGLIENTPSAINDALNSTVFANTLLVSVDGCIGNSHSNFDPPHQKPTWKTANGSNNVFVEGTPVTRTGDNDTCGHTRVGGSADFFVGPDK